MLIYKRVLFITQKRSVIKKMRIKFEQIKELPENYKKIVEELISAGFDIDELLWEAYDPFDIFEESETLVKMAIERIKDELETLAVKKPRDYIDGKGYFGWEIQVQDFVDDFLSDLSLYFKVKSEE